MSTRSPCSPGAVPWPRALRVHRIGVNYSMTWSFAGPDGRALFGWQRSPAKRSWCGFASATGCTTPEAARNSWSDRVDPDDSSASPALRPLAVVEGICLVRCRSTGLSSRSCTRSPRNPCLLAGGAAGHAEGRRLFPEAVGMSPVPRCFRNPGPHCPALRGRAGPSSADPPHSLDRGARGRRRRNLLIWRKGLLTYTAGCVVSP